MRLTEFSVIMKYSILVFLLGQLVASFKRPPCKITRTLPSIDFGWGHLSKILPHPTNKRLVVFMSASGSSKYLIIKRNNILKGTDQHKRIMKLGKFELQTYANGVVRIFNVRTRKYIAINKKGKAYVTRKCSNEDTLFKESFQNSFNTYRSLYHYRKEGNVTRMFYLALRKDGILRRPWKTLEKHRSIRFVVSPYRQFIRSK